MGIYIEKNVLCNLKAGDLTALDALYERYARKLKAFALRTVKSPDLAEDVIQDTFIRIWEKRTFIDDDRPFEPFLFTVCRNIILNLIKRAQKERSILEEMANHAQREGTETDKSLLKKETAGLISEGIQQLPPRCKAVFQLSQADGLSYKEIASELSISEHTVSNHMVKAFRLIRQHLKASFG